MQDPPEPEPHFERWPPPQSVTPPEWNMPDWLTTIKRGCLGRCPVCNRAPIFDGYLKVHDKCFNCGAPLGDMPADDAPPYIAMLVVLHFLALFVILFYKGYYHPGIFMAGFFFVALG